MQRFSDTSAHAITITLYFPHTLKQQFIKEHKTNGTVCF